MLHLFTLNDTHTHTHCMAALHEGSARQRDLYLITYYTHNRQTSTLDAGFEPTTAASERPQTNAFDHAAGHGLLSVVSVVRCQVVYYASGRSLVKRSPTGCGVSECDREVSITRKPCPTGGCYAMKKIDKFVRAGKEFSLRIGHPIKNLDHNIYTSFRQLRLMFAQNPLSHWIT
jgi:hypothetical protein